MSKTISYQRPDGQRVNGYLAEPAGVAGAAGIVVIQEWWGLNDQIRGVADKLAAAGYRALVPDLYRGRVALEAHEAEHLMKDLNFGDAAGQDVRGAVQYLKASGSRRVGVTGFCMGGRFTFFTACRNPTVTAAAPFYGGGIGSVMAPSERTPKAPLEYAEGLQAALLLFFGGDDPFIPLEEVERIKARLAALGKRADTIVYPGAPHGFFCEDRESYRADAAQDAWQRLLTFFDRHLRS